MNTSITLVPFIGVFLFGILHKSRNTFYSSIYRKRKRTPSEPDFVWQEEYAESFRLKSCHCAMDKPADETNLNRGERVINESQPSADIREGNRGGIARAAQPSDDKIASNNDPTSDRSITTLCDEQGFKTIIAVNHSPENSVSISPGKSYLETEIDSYSKFGFSTSRTSRPPTLPKPILKAFTFETSNPFLNAKPPARDASEHAHLYSEVNKPNSQHPKTPRKPTGIKAKAKHLENMLNLSSLSLARATTHERTVDESSAMMRVNSLPSLLSGNNGITDCSDLAGSNRLRLSLAVTPKLNSGYGQIRKFPENNDEHPKPNVSVSDIPKDSNDYCVVLPESPPYVNNLYCNTSRISDEEESIYEDVKTPNESQAKNERKGLKIIPNIPSDIDNADYVRMASPISEINFSFGRYENSDSISLPAMKHPGIFEVNKIYQNTSEFAEKGAILEPPQEFASFKTSTSVRNTSIPKPLELNSSFVSENQNVPMDSESSLKNISPSSSYAASSSQYSGNSAASTATSSFQGIQVCYFPPTPPPDFYNASQYCNVQPLTEVNQHPEKNEANSDASVHPTESSIKRASRSRIPKPVKPKRFTDRIQIPEEPAPPLPSTPNPSPSVERSNRGTEQRIHLSPPTPPSGKAMRWYEKLGCIQTGALQPSEPYGLPGERKVSKSKERRRSQFYVDAHDTQPSDDQ